MFHNDGSKHPMSNNSSNDDNEGVNKSDNKFNNDKLKFNKFE